MGRRRACGARRRPRPSPAATAIDVFYQHRYIGSRGRWWSKPLRRPRGSTTATTTTRVTVASTRLGSPLASTAAARWHFAHQRGQRAGRRATAPGGAPGRGHQQDIFATSRSAAGCESVKLIFLSGRMDTTAEASPPLNTDVSRRISERLASMMALSLVLGWPIEASASPAVVIRARWREQAAQNSGCDCVRCSPEQLRRTLKQSSSRALPCTAACERRRVRLRTKVARDRNDHISRGKTSSTSPSRTRASDATDPSE